MADWEEIKRLAADFQRTQTSDTLQRISERNCIDIIRKLTDLKLIELIYTCNGKEFLTPEYLSKQIEDEVYVSGGRVQLHALAAALNVDYQHVENMSKQIVAERSEEYNLIMGQIIHSTYKTTLEKQIHDTMITTGQLSIAEFSKSIDLPSEFLSTLVKELIPKVMDDFVVSQDERTYYTSDMLDRYKSIVMGTLVAISKPTTIASIMKRLDISERLFTPIVDGLVKEGRIDATIENRIFIPSIYAREQNEWIDKFYNSNSYIEYDVLLRKDIKQPKAFMKKRFPDGIQLKTCFISPSIMSQVEALVEDCIAMNSLIDISSILPPSIQIEDIEQMLSDIFKKNKQIGVSCLVLHKTNVCSLGYLATCRESLRNIMESKAREHLDQGKLMSYFLGGTKKTILEKKKQQQQVSSTCDDDTKTSSSKQEVSPSDGQAQLAADAPVVEMVKQEDAAGLKKVKPQIDDIEMTAEDLKREKRQKRAKAVDLGENAESDDEPDSANIKKTKSKKSGGGVQGREIKQKATKKKYMAGSRARQGTNDESDSDAKPVQSSKQPRSSKGRAARRGVSPETQVGAAKSIGESNRGRQASQSEKNPLVFLEPDDLIAKLMEQTQDSSELGQELFKSIASMLEADLNKAYESYARKYLDDYLKAEVEKDGDLAKDTEIDLVN